jgi:hypothetical protein
MRTSRLALITALAFTVTVGKFRADEPTRLLIHHISPAVSTIYVANADGTGERSLLPAPEIRGFADYPGSTSISGV